MRCDDARRELDGRLAAVEWPPALRDHLETCAGCRGYADRLQRLDATLREVGRSAPEVDERAFVTGVLGRLDRHRARRRTVWWFPVAAAAVLLAAVSIARLARAPRPATPPEAAPSHVVVTLAPAPSVRVTVETNTLSGVAGFVARQGRQPLETELAELAALPPL